MSEIFSISIRIHSIGAVSHVNVQLGTTIADIIRDLCQQNNFNDPDRYYLSFNDAVLENGETVENTQLHNLCASSYAQPELRTRTSHLLKSLPNLYVISTSLNEADAKEALNIELPLKIEEVLPENINKLCEKVSLNKISKQSNVITTTSNTETKDMMTLLPLPVFGHTIIDDLPFMKMKIPLNPDEFDWQILLQDLANSLEVDPDDLFILDATKGCTNWKIAFKRKILCAKEKMKKIQEKIIMVVKDTSSKLKQKLKGLSGSDTSLQEIPDIKIELENFDKVMNDDILIPEDLDLVYQLNERPAVVEETEWHFLEEKSRQLSILISESFINLPDEYVIDSMAIVSNEKLLHDYKAYSSSFSCANEKILFHGVKSIDHFDSIFEENLRFTGVTDDGWFGEGVYSTSSLKYAFKYDRTHYYNKKNTRYILCCVVSLGKTLHVKNMDFQGKPLHPDYDSHYVQVSPDRNLPIKNAGQTFYEEFVIKDKRQILPLYIIGVRPNTKFVVWRDAKMKNDSNSNTLKQLKEAHNLNIYGCETSDDALKMLKCKLSNSENRCIVVTNGADDGEGFVAECKKMQANLPIIVYCMNSSYHQTWANKLGGEPKIVVTTSQDDVFTYIKENLLQI